jgi:hypothetical protein
MTDEATLEAQLAALKALETEVPNHTPEELAAMTPEQLAALVQPPAPITTAELSSGQTGGTTVVIPPAPDASVSDAPPEHELSYLEHVGMELADMQIAMLSATEVTFKNGRTLPIVGFTDANGQQVTNLAFAKCAHAGDGSISIPLAGVQISR